MNNTKQEAHALALELGLPVAADRIMRGGEYLETAAEIVRGVLLLLVFDKTSERYLKQRKLQRLIRKLQRADGGHSALAEWAS